MLKLAIDENFNAAVVAGLRRPEPGIDIVRVQDRGLAGVADAEVLQWAAQEGHILVTHDRATISTPAYDRVASGLPMPGVIVVSWGAPIGQTVEALRMMALASLDLKMLNKVRYPSEFR
jgi:hypothetical protein